MFDKLLPRETQHPIYVGAKKALAFVFLVCPCP